MPDEEDEHPSIPELSEKDLEELSPEERADLLGSVVQSIDRIIEHTREEQRKLKEHHENISEQITHLEILQEAMQEYEKDAQKSAMMEEMEIDDAQEIVDNLTQLSKVDPSELEVEDK